MFVIIVVSTCTFLVGTYPDFQEPYIDFSTGAPQPDKYVSLDVHHDSSLVSVLLWR